MLYHTNLYVPQTVKAQVRTTGQVVPTYSPHALERAEQYQIDLPYLVDFTKCEPFEIETKRDGTIIKVGYRTRYQGVSNSDLILIIHPQDNYVRTIWVNQTNDQHATLNTNQYEKESS